MNNKHYYRNHITGEITYNHRAAIQWLRNGILVDIYFENQPEQPATSWVPYNYQKEEA